jgi:hypothetical protein
MSTTSARFDVFLGAASAALMKRNRHRGLL